MGQHYITDEKYDTKELPVPDMINLHQLLESIKDCDERIRSMYKQRAEYLNMYQTERDKLDAHYEMVVNRPVDPGPTYDSPTYDTGSGPYSGR